jgi:DNA/RNA-binding domain of Phe-tRNA-synthetase-like protein
MTHPALDRAHVDDTVRALCPDYVAILLVATGLSPGSSDTESDTLLAEAESAAQQALHGREPHELPHVAAWREAFRAFGAKPQRTRSSVEALLRRAEAGLPRIDRITDAYNAVSVRHAVPLGGEDLSAYVGPPRLVRADGTEPFDTTAGGEVAVEHPDAGEVVWRDDAGVTCRRWNWRQCVRTRITTRTTEAMFVLDGLPPYARTELAEVADDLEDVLRRLSPGATFARVEL